MKIAIIVTNTTKIVLILIVIIFYIIGSRIVKNRKIDAHCKTLIFQHTFRKK